MEYLTIEEKGLIELAVETQLKHIENQIKTCKELGISDDFWRKLAIKTENAIIKLKNQDSFEVNKIKKQYENTEPCKH